jgi:threonine dehydrogenase-like Zn-dependent dehydrogenase
MLATVMHGAGDVRVERVADARLIEPTDALLAVTHACICGRIQPGRVFDQITDLQGVPDGYRAMNARQSIKVMIRF